MLIMTGVTFHWTLLYSYSSSQELLTTLDLIQNKQDNEDEVSEKISSSVDAFCQSVSVWHKCCMNSMKAAHKYDFKYRAFLVVTYAC